MQITEKMKEAAKLVVETYELVPKRGDGDFLGRFRQKEKAAYRSAVNAFQSAAYEANPEMDHTHFKTYADNRQRINTERAAGEPLNSFLEQIAKELGKPAPQPYRTGKQIPL